MLDHMIILFNFSRTIMPFSIAAIPFYTPKGFQFLHIFANASYFLVWGDVLFCF
jgi:hypothetical protein